MVCSVLQALPLGHVQTLTSYSFLRPVEGHSSLFYELRDIQLFTFFTKRQLAWGPFGFVGAAAWSSAAAWTGLAMTLQLRAAHPFQEDNGAQDLDSAVWPPASPASGPGLSHMPGFIPL